MEVLTALLDYLAATANHTISAMLGLASWTMLAMVLGGTLLGICIGMLPGLTATMGVALLTTLTYRMEHDAALMILICLYVGAIYGGSRSAILLNIPGTPANAATTLDGYPLARAGQAGPAMGIATTGSFLGTVMYSRRAEIIRARTRLRDVMPEFGHIIRYRRTIARSRVLGTLIGVVPGVGEDIDAWISYGTARRASKQKEKFGKGSVEGLMAAETGNSAAPPGALIPVLTLGIPGSAPAAVLLAAMVLHGVRPGPMIMIEFPSFVYQVVVMMAFAALAILCLGILLTPLLLKVLAVRRERLMPVVFVLCVIGSYAIQQRMFDVWVMVIFGLIGFVLRQMKYPVAPLVLGIVLGDIFDNSFRRSWVINGGDFSFYFTRPICVVLMLLCAVTLLMSMTPVRRYFGPKLSRLSRGLFGGSIRILGAQLVLLRALGQGLMALLGQPPQGLPQGTQGLVQALGAGMRNDAAIVSAALKEMLHALLDLLTALIRDLLQLTRILPRP